MALTAATIFDLAGGTQSITFSNSGTVDQISFSAGTVTFSANSTYSLSKSDFALYAAYLNTFYNLLISNFPTLQLNGLLPLSQFDITHSHTGVEKITYTQNSLGANVYTINYLSLTTQAGFLGRSAVTITVQEFFMLIIMFQQYAIQVSHD